jgi:hypothetical protein
MTRLQNMDETNWWASAVSRTEEKGRRRDSRDSYHLLARPGSRRAQLFVSRRRLGSNGKKECRRRRRSGRGDYYIGHADKTLDREPFRKCPRPRSLQVGPVGRGLSHCGRPYRDGPNWAYLGYIVVEFAPRNIARVPSYLAANYLRKKSTFPPKFYESPFFLPQL